MKATYDNSFCMDSNCINYFEDTCMIAIAEEGTDIEPDNNTSYSRDSKECKEFKAGTFLEYINLEEEDYVKETTYKIATKYKYVGEEKIINPGDVFKKVSTKEYESIEGTEVTLNDLGKLYIAVDKMLYDFSNQL